jgi:hypothetical protein
VVPSHWRWYPSFGAVERSSIGWPSPTLRGESIILRMMEYGYTNRTRGDNAVNHLSSVSGRLAALLGGSKSLTTQG